MKQTLAFNILHEFLRDAPVISPHRYKAPHANTGTPPRRHYPRQPDYIFSKAHNEMIVKPRRLFKGHRP